MAEVVAEVAKSFEWTGPIGIGFPAPIKGGVTLMAANISDNWVGINADELFTKAPKPPVVTARGSTMLMRPDLQR